jgi:hypothetical protein
MVALRTGLPRPPASEGRDRRAGIGALLGGLLAILIVQAIAPVAGPPLYDGVIPVEAYRWLSPPPGEHGGAQGVTNVIPVSGSSSPLVALATTELTPQAQIFAEPGGLTMPAGTTSLTVSIMPVPPEAQPSDGHIAGNVYRITIVTQAGALVSAPPSAAVTVVLRHPDPAATDATLALLGGGGWQSLKSDLGLAASYVAIVTTFGDFALLAPGPGPSRSEASPTVGASEPVPTVAPTSTSAIAAPASDSGIPTVTILAGAATVLVLVALVALAVLPRRPRRGEWTERRDRRGGP